MEQHVKYLNGDINWLKNINKMVYRKLELPLLLKSRIQIKKNMFGIKHKLFDLMRSYERKFQTLAPEFFQPIRALRNSDPIPPVERKISENAIRFPLEKSIQCKLPPNIYLNGSQLIKPSMGKKGFFQCFTVERSTKTIKNHCALLGSELCKTDYYDLPRDTQENCYKFKLAVTPRFKVKDNGLPSPAEYYPKNSSFTTKSYSLNRKHTKEPVYYYPQTTVPMRSCNKNFSNPDVNRYAHNHNNGIKYSNPPRVHETQKRSIYKTNSIYPRKNLAFHNSTPNKDITYNTMVKKRNTTCVKSGKPVAFLSSSSRFKNFLNYEKPCNFYKKSTKNKINKK